MASNGNWAAGDDLPAALGAEYAELVRAANAVEAEQHITSKLSEAVDEGEIDVLAGLYTHRAVWRLQLGLVRKAEKDLQAALRCHLDDVSAIEVHLLLSQCYRELGRQDDAAQAAAAARQHLPEQSVVSPLVLRQVLASGEATNGAVHSASPPPAASAARSAPTPSRPAASASHSSAETVSDKPAAKLAPTARTSTDAPFALPTNGATTDQNAQSAANAAAPAVPTKAKKGSMSPGFFSSGPSAKRSVAPTAAPATAAAAAAEPLAPEHVTPNVRATAGPIRADPAHDHVAPTVEPPPPAAAAAPPVATPSDDDNGGDVDGAGEYAGASRYGGFGGPTVEMELDSDELEAALNTPLRLTTQLSQVEQFKMMSVIGEPGARQLAQLWYTTQRPHGKDRWIYISTIYGDHSR
jgi:hypothetical protein